MKLLNAVMAYLMLVSTVMLVVIESPASALSGILTVYFVYQYERGDSP